LQSNVFLAEDHIVSGIVEVDEHPFELQAFPNPTRYELDIKAKVTRTSHGILQIIDQLGRLVHQEAFYLVPGVNTVEVSAVSELPAGLYHVQLTAEDKRDFVTVSKVE